MNKHAIHYHNLPLSQRTMELIRRVDGMLQIFPKTPQGHAVAERLFKAATDIGANIAQGYGRGIEEDQRRLLCFARGSTAETHFWLRVARECKLVSPNIVAPILALAEQITEHLCTAILQPFEDRANGAQGQTGGSDDYPDR